jgi:hypothetical protein
MVPDRETVAVIGNWIVEIHAMLLKYSQYLEIWIPWSHNRMQSIGDLSFQHIFPKRPYIYTKSMGPYPVKDSVDGIEMCYGLEGPGIEIPWRRNFQHPVQKPLGPTQPPVKRVPCLSLGGKAAGAWLWTPIPSSAEFKRKSISIPLLLLWVFMAHFRVNFTFTFTIVPHIDPLVLQMAKKCYVITLRS